jgi:transketolase
MPSQEIFASQDQAYRDSVLPKGIKRVAIEAAHPMSWYRWVGDDGVIIGIERFGASAPAPVIYEHLGITADRVVEAAKKLAGKA